MLLHNVVEIEKEEVECPRLCHLVAGEYNIKWQYLIRSFVCNMKRPSMKQSMKHK